MNGGKTLSLWLRGSYFFRDGTPFTAGEDIFLSSGFPPSGKVIGAVRTALLSGHGVDFDKYYEGYCNVCQASAEDCLVLRAVGSSRGGGGGHGARFHRAPLSPVRLMGPSSGSTRRPMTSSSWMVKVGWDG